jgi:hypothetical protein
MWDDDRVDVETVREEWFGSSGDLSQGGGGEMEPVFNFRGSAIRSVTAFAGLPLRKSSRETRFLIGHENGFLHPRTAFRLAAERTVGR